MALWAAYPLIAGAISEARRRPPSWTQGEIDTTLLHTGFEQAPRFSDTLRWWTGPWIGTEQVPFYRPLTSYVFWFEFKAVGDREWLLFLPSAAAHVLATVLFAALVFHIARQDRLPAVIAAVVGAAAFTGLALMRHRAGFHNAFQAWKNQPDTLAAICCCAAVLSYLRAVQQDQRLPVGAMAWYLAACGFKEIAIPLPLVCLPLEWGRLGGESRRRALTRLGALGACGAGFLVVRQLALGSIGYQYGSNLGWLPRTLGHLLGPFGDAGKGVWTGAAGATWAFLVLLTAWRLRRRPGARVRSASPRSGRFLPAPP